MMIDDWLFWVLSGFFALSSLITIGMVGKKREPTTPGTAIGIVIINALIILMIVLGWPR